MTQPPIDPQAMDAARQIWSPQQVQKCLDLLGPGTCRRLGIFHLPDGFTLSVIVPAYDEAATIARVVDGVLLTG
ncbi:MAG: glycosyltransferase family 2 protein, partial [Planctomycetota bacterium]